VYNPALEIVPTVLLPPAVPLTLHVTAVLELPLTVAVNCCVCPTRTDMVVGETLTETPCVTVAVACADLVESAALVAVIVTLPPEGTAAGAV
jgi:hypothetical protein